MSTNAEAKEGVLLPGNPEVIEAMKELVRKHERETAHLVENAELDIILSEIRAVALANIVDLFETRGGAMYIKDLESLPRHVSAGIASIQVKRDKIDGEIFEIIDFKMHPKMPAANMLMRYHGAYEKDNEQRGVDSMDMLLSYIGGSGISEIEDNTA